VGQTGFDLPSPTVNNPDQGAKFMKNRGFAVTSAITLFLAAGIVGGLAFYSTVGVNAQVADLPASIAYIPQDVQAVFGMNVERFIGSSIYQVWEQQHGAEFATDLAEFTSKTGVDPRKDIRYIIAAGKADANKNGKGVIIAEARVAFDSAAITSFINTKVTPVPHTESGVTVLMIPEKDGSRIEKGIAFLGSNELALGDLESLKAMLETKKNKSPNVTTNATLAPLLRSVGSGDMFWFAGDPSNVLAKAPTNTPLGGNISSITNVFGTLNLDTAVKGTIIVTANTEVAAKQLADVARGLMALGQLAGDQNPELVQLLQGITIGQSQFQVQLNINFPFEVLDKLKNAKPLTMKKVA
jgi:hypothetical protein